MMDRSDKVQSNNTQLQLHVGLVGDGVRRWAKLQSIPLKDAYIDAMSSVATFINFFFSNSANILSLYMLSKDNLLRRRKEELEAAFEGEMFFFRTVLYDLVKEWNCSVYLAGYPELLPVKYTEAIRKLMQLSDSTLRKIYLLAGYSPIDEIQQAIQGGGVDFQDYLWVPEPVDIVIRTSGEYRISNFLPLQIGYAELFFLKKHINELSKEDYKSVLEEYYKRNRRFGK